MNSNTYVNPDWCDFHAVLKAECDCSDPDKVHRGHLRIAYRLAKETAGKLLYVRGIGWLCWDGQRWAKDETDAAKRAVFEVLHAAWDEARSDRDLQADIRKSESSSGVNSVLELAAALPALRAAVDELDADPHLFNCANGTLDLRTRALLPHNPADRITRVTKGAYEAGNQSADWEKFLTDILPDQDVRGYLQRVIGQSIYGRVREHLFPVLTGTGANGKGTAYAAITNALGRYATIINPDLLMASDRGPGGPEMMALLGARLVVGSETAEGRQMDAATMKRLTGGDELTARHLYEAPVSWMPSHQLVYVTNHLPQVKGNDPAVWRRVRVIPFDVTVAPENMDEQLPEKLELAADAILTWAVQGWFDYEDHGGMNAPASVLAATDRYQTDSDAVKRFIQTDAVVINNQVSAKSRQLYSAWVEWAAVDGCDPLKETPFTKELDRLGFPATKTRAGMVRNGIGLRAVDHENGE